MNAIRAVRVPTMAPWIALIGGVAFMTEVFSHAAAHPGSLDTFHLFWVAVLVFVVPAAGRLLIEDPSRNERLALCVALGLFMFLPKFLRDPSGPLFSDELAHWRQAQTIVRTGHVFNPSPLISVIEYFPGLHLLTAALQELTGLSTFAVASLLLATVHAVTLLGVFLIGERILGSARSAGIAALVFSLNPSFMYFDSQYAYESLAIGFFVWTLVAATFVERAESQRERLAWIAAGFLTGGACVVTHHITSYILVFVLLLLAVLAVRKGPREATSLLVLAALVTGAAASWLILIASSTVAYISPHVTSGIHEVFSLIHREQGGRQLFRQTVDPLYERLAAYAAPPVVLALTGFAALRRRLSGSAVWAVCITLSALYFASLPFILTTGGEEGARRSWGFTYLGIAVLAAVSLGGLTRHYRQRGILLALAAITVVLVGNVAADLNPDYRFPGKYVFGSDTRSLSTELRYATSWLRRTQGANRRVVADRYSALALASFGDEWTAQASAGFPVWQLYFLRTAPSPVLVDELRSSGYRYLVVDRRLAEALPALGFYIAPDEPLANARTRPVPAAALQKLDVAPWAIKLFNSGNLEIYRLDFAQLDSGTASQ